MKRIFAIIFSSSLLIMLCSCGEKPIEGETTVQPTVTNPPPYTTVIDGKNYTAQKLASQDDNYQIGYFDDQNRASRFEYYKDGKLSYYYISSDFDENGNDNVQKYYSADGKLLGTADSGKFFDADGKEISETEMSELLPS